MAVQGSGIGKGLASFKDQTSYDARSGAPKRIQKDIAVKSGMKDQTAYSGVAPANPGVGPDAAPGNPLAGNPGKGKQLSTPKAAWGQTDADGKGLDHDLGGRVVGEAILGGSHLPSAG